MKIAFGIDPDQGLSADDEIRLAKLGAQLGYESAWVPSRADDLAFARLTRWHEASGLPVGISAVPASGQSPDFYAEHAQRLWDATGGRFILVVGSGRLAHAATAMRDYLPALRSRLPHDAPLYLAALGPGMLRVGAELADGVALNWCTAEQVRWSRSLAADTSRALGRSAPGVIAYIRTAVDPDAELARRTVGTAAQSYALGAPAYRRHFQRMGFDAELRRIERSGIGGPGRLVQVGAAGTEEEARERFKHLAAGLDLAIVRVLVTRRGDFDSARRALIACRPLPERHS